MKKIIAAMLSAMVGIFGYTIVDTAIESRVSTLENKIVVLESQIAEYHGTTYVPEDTTTKESTTKETTTKETTTKVPTSELINFTPQSEEEIIAYYNAVVNNAYSSRVGFNKVRYTDNETLDSGFLFKTFGDLIYSFMGIGEENKYTMDVTKGQWEEDVPHHYLRKSTLTSADVTKATCTESNGKYTIKFNVKPGNSKASKNESYNNSPIDKCGICVGDLDKSYFDHKTAPVIYAFVGQVVSSAVIEESYDNATIVAVIDVATGHLVSLTVEYDINVVIDTSGGGNATGTAHILYKDFKY